MRDVSVLVLDLAALDFCDEAGLHILTGAAASIACRRCCSPVAAARHKTRAEGRTWLSTADSRHTAGLTPGSRGRARRYWASPSAPSCYLEQQRPIEQAHGMRERARSAHEHALRS